MKSWGGLTYRANELDFDTRVFQPLAILRSDCDATFDRFTVHVKGCLVPSILFQLEINHLSVVGFIEDDIDIQWGGEEVRHGRDCESKTNHNFQAGSQSTKCPKL